MGHPAVGLVHLLQKELVKLVRQPSPMECHQLVVVAARYRVVYLFFVPLEIKAVDYVPAILVVLEVPGVGVDPVLDQLVPVPVGPVWATGDRIDEWVSDDIGGDMARI